MIDEGVEGEFLHSSFSVGFSIIGVVDLDIDSIPWVNVQNTLTSQLSASSKQSKRLTYSVGLYINFCICV